MTAVQSARRAPAPAAGAGAAQPQGRPAAACSRHVVAGAPFLAGFGAPPKTAWEEAFDEASQEPELGAALTTHAEEGDEGERLSLVDRRESFLAEERAPLLRSWRLESGALLRLALPMALTNLCGYCIAQVTVIFVGRLGAEELSAAILATSLFNVTGLSVLTGFSAAMETLAGQAYGARAYRSVGVVLQRALLIVTLLTAALAALWTRSERLLLLAGQDAAIAGMAARYILRMLPALYCVGLSEAFKRYLMAQRCVRPVAAVTLLSLLAAPLLNWLLIFRLGLGFAGAAYAVDAVQFFMAACLGGFIVFRDRSRRHLEKSTWGGWTRQAFSGWPQYFRFALPSVIMVCVEWWTFEALILMAGWLPNAKVTLAAAGIGINTTGMIFMLYSGLSQALSIRVSNSLGAGTPGVAKRATWAAESLGLVLSAAAGVALAAGAQQWPRLFTNIPDVVSTTALLMPIFAITLPGDGTNVVLQGMLRGAGAQKLGALSNIASFWCFGIPLSYYLAFPRGLGIRGLWWGLFAVNCEVGLALVTIALTFNFKKASQKAVARFAHAAAALPDAERPLLAEDGAANDGAAARAP